MLRLNKRGLRFAMDGKRLIWRLRVKIPVMFVSREPNLGMHLGEAEPVGDANTGAFSIAVTIRNRETPPLDKAMIFDPMIQTIREDNF
jgi:hypothetical protein